MRWLGILKGRSIDERWKDAQGYSDNSSEAGKSRADRLINDYSTAAHVRTSTPISSSLSLSSCCNPLLYLQMKNSFINPFLQVLHISRNIRHWIVGLSGAHLQTQILKWSV